MTYKKIIYNGFFFGHSLRLSKKIVIEWDEAEACLHFYKWQVCIRNTQKKGLTFSERNGYSRITKIGNYGITCKMKRPDEIDVEELH